YAGLTDLIRRHLASASEDEVARLAAIAADLAGLVPELNRAVTTAAVLAGEQDKRRLLEACAHLLLSVANGKPIAVVFEDLQWADDASLELLLHLARSTAA